MDGYGGPYLFNATPDLLERTADESLAIMSVLLMGELPDNGLAGAFHGFEIILRERSRNPDPAHEDTMILTNASAELTERVLRVLEGLGGVPGPTSEVWRQVRGAIIANRRSRHPGPEDRTGP